MVNVHLGILLVLPMAILLHADLSGLKHALPIHRRDVEVIQLLVLNHVMEVLVHLA